MIYQVKDNKKIPLGAQFDNSWQIEYDRDLSSQLEGKNTWTATEDCWFQHSVLWNSKVDSTPYESYLNNSVKVSIITYFENEQILLQTTNILMKKGDKIVMKNKYGANWSFTATNEFGQQKLRVFPIHRILSKDDGHYYTEHFDLPSSYDNNSKIVTIDTSQLLKELYTPYQITACIGSDADIFAFSIIAYKIWNGDVYYSTIMNRVGVIQTVTDKTITYKIGGSFANVTASAIKL